MSITGFRVKGIVEKYDYNSLDNLPGATTDEEIMDVMTEMELIEPVSLLDGSILISNKNEIYSL